MLGLVAAVALLLGMLAPPASAANVRLISSFLYGPDSIDNWHLVGEVENTGSGPARFIEISFGFYDSTGRLLDTDFTFTMLDMLGPGQRSPFHEIFDPPPGFASYSIDIYPDDSTQQPNRNFTTTVTNTFVDSAGYSHIVGQVTNNNTTTASFVQIVFSFRDSSGRVVDADFTFVDTGSDAQLQPGQTGSFELIYKPPDVGGPITFEAVAESSTPPSSPPPPTQSPTASPSASSSPTSTPAYERSVVVRLRGHLRATGFVAARPHSSECEVGVSVRLQRRVEGQWVFLRRGTDETDGTGVFEVALRDRPGLYRARVPMAAPCPKATSAPARHRH